MNKERSGDFNHIHSSAWVSPHATIGTRPFVTPRSERGLRQPSVNPEGGVRIYAFAEVFAHANVDQGIEGETTLGPRVKIDHYVHVGHDAIIEEDSCLCAGVVVAGYAHIGKRVTIGIGARIGNRVKIGDDCYIGAGAVVIRDVRPNTKCYGNPAHKNEGPNWDDMDWEGIA